MRVKIHSILIGTALCAHLGATGALAAAHPTHILSHRDARRPTLQVPAHMRSAHHSAPESAHRRHPSAQGRATEVGHLPPDATRPNPSTHRHFARNSHRKHLPTEQVASAQTAAQVHAWEQARAGAQTGDAGSAPPSAPAQAALSTTIATTAPELPRIPTIQQEAATPVLLPSLYDRRGHLVMPPPLYGSREILMHQNLMADRDGLTRVRDDDEMLDLRRQRKLVPLPEGETLHVDDRLPSDRRFSRPWTAEFLAVLARDFYNRFHEPLQVNSAVRTVQIQEHLQHVNGNAAPAEGDTASPHLTGQAVDIGKRGLTLPEIAWMRIYLAPLIEQGKIDVEEEFHQSCFHISVYKAYQQPVGMDVAALPAAAAN